MIFLRVASVVACGNKRLRRRRFLVLIGAYKVGTTVTALTATGVVLGAAYMLFLYKRVVFGEGD